MADVKTVRLENAKTGVVVETSEAVASNLSGFVQVKKSAKATEESEKK